MSSRRIFLHPFYLISLSVFFVNDFVLKFWVPGLVTGKLSDFAGLVVLSLFLYGLFPGLFHTTIRKIILLTGCGILLALLQLSTFLDYYSSVLLFLGLPQHTLTADVTDLIALSILPFVFIVMYRYEGKPRYNPAPLFPVIIIALFSFLTLCATSIVGSQTITLKKNISRSVEIEKTLFLLQEQMIENDIKIIRNHLYQDSIYTIHVRFDDELWYGRKDEKISYSVDNIDGSISFIIDSIADSLQLIDITFTVYGHRLRDTTAVRLYNKNFAPLFMIEK